MKRLQGIIIGIALSMAVVGTVAQAGLFDLITTSGWESKDTTAKYLVEVKGFDIRAYEFVNARGKNCTAVFGNQGPVGLSCTD